MKTTSTTSQSNHQSAACVLRSERLRTAFLSLVIALPVSITTLPSAQAQSSNRVVQELGACNAATAQFIGNAHKGRSQLTSSAPDGIAGFIFDGLRGTTVKQLATLDVDFEPPKDVSTYEVTLRVLVAGVPNRVQNFTVGADDNPNLPNLPTTKFGDVQELHVLNGPTLLGDKSKLAENDVIEKISFIFHGTKNVNGKAVICNVIDTAYAGGRLPTSLERVTCNLR